MSRAQNAPSSVPERLARCAEAARVQAAVQATRSAGAALLELRGKGLGGEEVGTQLKTAVDEAAEGWVLGFLRASFPEDLFLAEEAFERAGGWEPQDHYWTIDSLDGTRSFIEGYPGFCVQVAWVSEGKPIVGVVYEPVARACYMAVAGEGAFRVAAREEAELRLDGAAEWPPLPRFVDSTVPKGRVGELFEDRRGELIECGSIGLKLCRVAEGAADLFVKQLTFKLWDVAPAQVILDESGAQVGLWDGSPIRYDTEQVHFQNILAAPNGLFGSIADAL